MIEKICNSCGRRLSEFYSTYMLGCPNCYQAFKQEIFYAVKKAQGATVHSGKMPKTSNIDKQLINEYERLIKEIEDATIDGRFSRIKELSEDLIEITNELKRRGLL